LETSVLVACNSFFREAALPWEQYAVQELKLPILNVRDWPCFDTNFFLRGEIIAYIRTQGGVTEEAGARRVGRLRVSLGAEVAPNVSDGTLCATSPL
jgi:hypothetical protein